MGHGDAILAGGPITHSFWAKNPRVEQFPLPEHD